MCGDITAAQRIACMRGLWNIVEEWVTKFPVQSLKIGSGFGKYNMDTLIQQTKTHVRIICKLDHSYTNYTLCKEYLFR
jgi:hypothetical protein